MSLFILSEVEERVRVGVKVEAKIRVKVKTNVKAKVRIKVKVKNEFGYAFREQNDIVKQSDDLKVKSQTT